jgi:hypothetical protein
MEDIEPPLDLLYNSYEEAYNALKTHGLQHGYGFVLKRSKPHKSDVKTRYYYPCDRFRKYKSSAKILSTSTRSVGCHFKLVIFKVKHSDQWKLEVQDKHHSHPRSINPSAHVYRKRTHNSCMLCATLARASSITPQVKASPSTSNHSTVILQRKSR